MLAQSGDIELLERVKELFVVLVIAAIVFSFAKPLLGNITLPKDYARRVMVWTALTVTAFLSHSFWLYVLVAVPLLVWGSAKDSNPLALYVFLLFVIPPVEIQIPTGDLLNLFDLSQFRLMGLVVLVPRAFRELHRRNGIATRSLRGTDALLLAFGAIQIAGLLPYETLTNTGRRTFLYILDTLLVYYVFSRGMRDRVAMNDLLGALLLAATVLASVAVFESLKGWLLYTGLRESWNASVMFSYLLRGANLRAQASAGHALTLGFTIAVAICCWLHLKGQMAPGVKRVALGTVLLAGLYFTYSRGPWLTAMVIVAVFVLMERASLVRLGKAVLPIAALGAVVLATPIGSNIVSLLPFIGSAEQDTIAYRRELAETSWQLIRQNPWFGDPFVLQRMENLRQGQDGIIDLVNAYASVALFNGGVGLFFYVAALLSGMLLALRHLRSEIVQSDQSFRSLGACLVACMMGLVIFMGFSGFSAWQWHLLGLLCAYACWVSPYARPGQHGDAARFRSMDSRMFRPG